MIKFQTLGSDPEVFLAEDDQIVSAIGKIGGTKKEPIALGEGYFAQEDNVLAEFNIRPSESEAGFAESMKTGVNLLKLHVGKNYKLVAKASHRMDEKELNNEKAKAFGCEPDTLAWNGEVHVASPPEDGYRTAGGHVHFGYEDSNEQTNIKLAKAFDIFLGLPSVLLDPDRKRREIYGGAGAMRHKKYGLEYRTLSSFWVLDELLCRWVYRQCQEAAAFVDAGHVDKLSVIDGMDIITAINFCDKVLAQELIDKYKVRMP